MTSKSIVFLEFCACTWLSEWHTAIVCSSLMSVPRAGLLFVDSGQKDNFREIRCWVVSAEL